MGGKIRMKNVTRWLILGSLIGLILSGCGTKDQANESTPTQEKESNKQEQEEQNNLDKPAGENPQNQEQSDENDPILEQKLQINENGELKEHTAFLKASDNQSYSMYVLPEFELTAEEPNKDVLFLSENDHIFMRIELLPTDVDWDLVEENTKAQLQAINETIQNLEVQDDDFFKDAVAMEASKDEDVVTSYLIKSPRQPLKLSIFTKKDTDYRETFIQMAKTIVKSE